MILNIISQIVGIVGSISAIITLIIVLFDKNKNLVLKRRIKRMLKKNKGIVLDCRVIGNYLFRKYNRKYTLENIDEAARRIYVKNRLKDMYMESNIDESDSLKSTTRFWVGNSEKVACTDADKDKYNKCIPASRLNY